MKKIMNSIKDTKHIKEDIMVEVEKKEVVNGL
jgi:hypothetical protein